MWGLLGPLTLVLALFVAGCESDNKKNTGVDSSSFLERFATNTETRTVEVVQPAPEPAAEPEVAPAPEEAEEEAEEEGTPAPEPEPDVTPPPVVADDPYYSPGEVKVPADFLNHGGITYLRFQHCSIANGLLVETAPLVYSIPPPEDPIWRKTDEFGCTDIGTEVRFADGTVYDGYVTDYNGEYPMPLLPKDDCHGPAFWERDY